MNWFKQYFDQKGLKRAKQRWISSYVNDEQHYYYMFTRYHIGSMAAFLLSIYNLYQIRQKIIKHAIFFTKSNKPHFVKPAMVLIGFAYWLGLLAVWHIPSIGAESAVRTYIATEDAVTTYCISGQEIVSRAMNKERKKTAFKKFMIPYKQ